MRNLLIFIMTLACALLGRTSSAQVERNAARVPVLLAFVDTHPRTGSRFRLVRLQGESVRDVALLPWSERVLLDLCDAHPRQVATVGHVRAVQIWLAPRSAGAAGANPDFGRNKTGQRGGN